MAELRAKVAIAWTLNHPAVTGAIVGSNRRQVEGIIGAAAFRMNAAEIAEIDEIVARESAA